jgi:hypothetical protein
MEWDVAEARDNFTDLLDRVKQEGPQQIRQGDTVYVITSQSAEPGKHRNRLVEIIRSGPSWEGLEIGRIPGGMREVDL